MPTPGVAPQPLDSLPAFAPPKSVAPSSPDGEGHNMIWDQLGRALFGSQAADPDTGQHGGLLGDIPGVSDIARVPGSLVRGLADAGGVGLGAVMGGAAEVLGRIPSSTHLTDAYGLGNPTASKIDPLDAKYGATPEGAMSLINDLKGEQGGGNIAAQFMLLGQWQKANDPEAFKAWEETLKRAQGDTNVGSKAGEYLSNYLREWAVSYADLTPEGITGWLDVAPELAYGTSGSFGQGLTDGFASIMSAQRQAEVGAATLSGNQSGLSGALGGRRVAPEYADMGSRLNELLQLSDDDPKKLTEVEAAAVYGMKELGWTARHAYAYLVRHSQGFSSDGLTQTALSMALDPFFVGSLGASSAASVGERAALGYARTATSAGRLTSVYRGIAERIGTTVAATRADPILGPAFKVARTVVDPFSAIPGPHGSAKVDVFASAGLEATRRGFSPSATGNFFKRASSWGVRDIADRAFGQTAMNFARKYVATRHVDNLARAAQTGVRRELTEDVIKTLGENSAKDAVTRMADYVYSKREFFLNQAGEDALAERIVKMTGQTLDTVKKGLAEMTDDERAIWHATSYSEAFSDFVTAARAVPEEEWGSLASKLDDLVPLNPMELDKQGAQALLDSLKGSDTAIDDWNAAARKYTLIDNLGPIHKGGTSTLERRVNALQRVIDSGQLHQGLDITEFDNLPDAFKRDFVAKWTDSAGQPIWRLGFKPKALQATGLVYDDAGELAARFEPAIENVTHAIPKATGGMHGITDPVGRLIPGAVKGSRLGGAARTAYDSLDVALSTASDMVSGERVITSMEQSFRKQMRTAGYSDKVAKQVFKASRTYVQDNGFTLAGMSPADFWKANEANLAHLVDSRVAQRDVFSMLAKSAGGDLRLLGLSSGATQRIRSGLIARGLDPNNYMGAVTVKLYNLARYTLNPMFFLQAEFDAPWFNMYRGVMPDLRGIAPKPGSALYEMQGIVENMGHTSMSRDLAMDYTERAPTIGWQQDVLAGLKSAGIDQALSSRIKGRLGRMILNNEMAYLNSRAGEVVFDAIKTTKRTIEERAANAATPAEAAAWRNQTFDIERVLDSLTEELSGTLGRSPTPDEVGRRYLSEMIEDSRLEVRTKEGLLDYQRVAQKGAYHVPTNVGELKPLNLDYGAESLGLPNIFSAKGLRKALADGLYSQGEVRDRLFQLGYHGDHIDRFMTALNFQWRPYFDNLAQDLGMSTFEMQGIEDLIAKEAKSHGLSPIDYFTQVLPMTTKTTKRTSGVAEQVAGKAEYASTGRSVSQSEMEALRQRGEALMNVPGAKEPVDLAAGIDKVADDLYQRTALTEWGGASYSPRTGKFIEDTNQYLHHGTNAANEASIAQAGINRGEFADLAAAKRNALGKSVIYRARDFDVKGMAKGEGWKRVSGKGVPPESLQISRDGGVTWEPVVAGAPGPDGPWVSGVGKTTSISIAEAQDPAKFRAALDQFVADNADQLQQPGMFVGTFRDEKLGQVQFDVSRATFSEADTEAVQAFLGREGGAYNTATGNGLFAPRVDKAMGVEGHMKFILDTLRLAEQGKAGADEMAQLVAANLQPSMKEALLDHFMERITGKNGLIEQAMAAGDAKTAQDLNLVLEDLRGGWGKAADNQFRDLVLRRAGDEVSSMGDHLPQPWKDPSVNAYHKTTELVPTRVLDDLMEIDREVTPKFKGDFAHLDELTEDIRVNGFREPVILDYDPVNGLALLGEGNHRLAVAKRLGLEGVPTRVVKTNLSKDPKAVPIAERYEPILKPNADGYFPGDASPSQIGLPMAADIAEPEVERAARYFSKYVQDVAPNIGAGTALKNIVENIPVEGASPFHFTQSVLMDTLHENFRLAEKDAIRLAHMQTERSVLERSINHPFFAMYPSSYFWGKVIPETFRFIAYQPFGLQTSAGLSAYLHVKQSVELQSMYDDRLAEMWKDLGKSAIMGLFSYISPSMPWEDMSSALPPWARALAKGEDFKQIMGAEFDTFSPDRWVKHFIQAGQEGADIVGGAVSPEPEVPSTGGGAPASGRELFQGTSLPEPAGAASSPGFQGTVKGLQLGPILTGELSTLQDALSGR